MSTYIDLCKKLRLEVGASGNDSTVVGATGEWKRLCDWIALSWNEIQQAEATWEWMRKTKTFNTTIGQSTYTLSALSITDHAHWKNESFRIYQSTVDDEVLLGQLEYEFFRDVYLIGSHTTTNSRPTVISVNPAKSLVLALPPDNTNYTVTGEYYATPTDLVNDADTPAMPARFHQAIVYYAMTHYGYYEAAQDVLLRAERGLAKYMDRLRFDQLPRVVIRRKF